MLVARVSLDVRVNPLVRTLTPRYASGRRCLRAHRRVKVRGEGPAPGKTKTPKLTLRGLAGGSDRRRSGDLSIFSRTLYQLSYRAKT